MKSRGVVLFAHNNELINYVRQAVFCAKQITMHLKLPVTLVSSTVDDVSIEDHAVFDKIITVEKQSTRNNKTFNMINLIKCVTFNLHAVAILNPQEILNT